MEKQQLASNEVEQFLEDVADQIQYKPIRNEIKEELAAHLLDHIEDFVDQGMEESEATHKAVECMGEPIEIGVKLNEVRKIQIGKPILVFIAISVLLGIMGNVQGYFVQEIDITLDYYLYFVWGIGIFSVVYFYGYQKVVQYMKQIFIFLVVIWVVPVILFWLGRTTQNMLFYKLTNISNMFALELLSIPLIIGIAYLKRRKKYLSLIFSMIVTGVLVCVSLRLVFDYILSAGIILIISVFVSLKYMIEKEMFAGTKTKQNLLWATGLVLVLLVLMSSIQEGWKTEIEKCFYPEKVAVDYFDDAYNSVLMKELLSRSEMLGTVKINQENMLKLYTGEWFLELDDFEYKCKMREVEENKILLEDILPEHYHNNYRIAYWILKFGWLPATILILIVLSTYGMLLYAVSKIRNKMGKVLAYSSASCLVFQAVLYFFGNFGYQVGWFTNLPFISEGIYSITVNMILAGLVCSAYRYDKVIKEETWEVKKNLFQ